MQEFITVFNAKKTNTSSKVCWSIYDDNTFIFNTYKASNNLEMYSAMCSNFVLNIPLAKLETPIRTFRRKANLEQYYNENITYIVLDIDDVNSEEHKTEIINYFKNFKVIIGQSKSYNGINNFRMKGILFTDDIPLTDAKLAISSIHHALKEFCTIDEASVRRVTFNAPMMKNEIFLNNETGKRFSFKKEDTQQNIEKIKKQYVGDSISISVQELENIEANTIEKLCLQVFQTMGFVAIKNNPNDSISFKHPNEKKSTGGYFWFSVAPYTMHHPNSTKSINIFDSVRKLPQAKELLKLDINYDDQFLNFNTDTSILSVNEKYLQVSDKVQNKVQEFLENPNGMFSIRSPMGTGKSTIISYIIEECHDLDMRVLIITNRISVAKDFSKKYNIKIYSEDKFEIGDSFICQYDSLWKYNISHFDVVVMDEFISLMNHSRSNLTNSSINIAKFVASFKKKLVIADAFLTGYENFLLSDKKENVHMIDNNYRDPTILYSYDDMNYFTQSILVHADKHKITISATSLSFINGLQALLTKRGKNVVTLTADTPESTKNLIYDLFERDDHDKWDVLIFSPTLTVGVSNLNNVPYHFHFDSSMSTDAISSIQMIKRTRKTKEIHMFIKEKINYIKTSYNDIRDEYMGNIGRNISQNYLFEIDDYGESKLSKIGKIAIKIDTFKNILEFNHKAGMLWLLKYHFMKEPRIIADKFQSNILHTYQRKIREDERLILIGQIDQFLKLNDIDKTTLLMETDADKTLRILAEMDDELIDCPKHVKAKILELSLLDKSFIQKCKFYRVAYYYTRKIWDDSDVKNLVSQAVIKGKGDDLHFYNTLLSYGQNAIEHEYLPKSITSNKRLKYILETCGYKITRLNKPGIIGHRGFKIDDNIKAYFGYIK